MTDTQEKLIGVKARIDAIQKRLMDAQTELAQLLAILEIIRDEAEETETEGNRNG